jgi:hypothetical protein
MVARRMRPGPPSRRASGHPLPRRSGLYKPPLIKRGDAPRSQLPPRHRLSLPLALVRQRLQRRRGTEHGERRRVRPPWSKPPLGIGGGASPESIPHVAVEFCFLSVTPSPSNSRPCTAGELQTLADEHDAPGPLDRDPSVAYRFGALSDLTGGLHLSGLKTETYPAPGEAVWAGPFGFCSESAC